MSSTMSCLWDRTKNRGDLRLFGFDNVIFVRTVVGPVIFRFKKSNFPFQKKGNSVSIPFHYWQR